MNILELKPLLLAFINIVSICLFYYIYKKNSTHQIDKNLRDSYLFILTMFTVILNVLLCALIRSDFLNHLANESQRQLYEQRIQENIPENQLIIDGKDL
jgi:hypothetical protein